MLDLAPTLEHTIAERAEANGMTTNEFLSKLIDGAPMQLPRVADEPPAWTAPAPDHSADTQRAALHALLSLPKEEIIRRNAHSIALLQAQLDEAAKATPEEIARADAEWEEHKRRMNAHRAEAGARPLFADVASE